MRAAQVAARPAIRMRGDGGASAPGEYRWTAGRQRSSETPAAPPTGHVQAVYEAVRVESQSTSTSSRVSFAKA